MSAQEIQNINITITLFSLLTRNYFLVSIIQPTVPSFLLLLCVTWTHKHYLSLKEIASFWGLRQETQRTHNVNYSLQTSRKKLILYYKKNATNLYKDYKRTLYRKQMVCRIDKALLNVLYYQECHMNWGCAIIVLIILAVKCRWKDIWKDIHVW